MDIEKSVQNYVDWLIAIGFMVAGAVFVVWPLQYLADGIEMASWEEKECIIDRFWFEQPEPNGYWHLHVRYYYRYDDKDYTSENLSLDAVDFMDIADAGPMVSEMTPGAEYTCFVNTDYPQESILFRPMKLEMFLWSVGLFFGVSFIIIGVIAFKGRVAHISTLVTGQK